MNISINIPNSISKRVIDGIAYQHGYTDKIHDPKTETDIDNPETKGKFAKRMLIQWIKDNVKAWEVEESEETARQDAIDSVDKDITIT